MKQKFSDGNAFYTTERIGKTRELTPEGYMLCRNVPISRVGVFEYKPSEVSGVKPGKDGLIHLGRTADELFSDDTVKSFEGKPVVIGHSRFADPANWREISVGIVQNVRADRESGQLLADLLLTDKKAIELVKKGELEEVSCGYDALPQDDGNGAGHQEGIIGNHVALVSKARCGDECRIGDGFMKKLSFRNRIRRMFKDGDEEGLNDLLDNADVSEKQDEEQQETDAKTCDEDPAPEEKAPEVTLADLSAKLDRILEALQPKEEPAEEVKDEDPEAPEDPSEEAPAEDPDEDPYKDEDPDEEVEPGVAEQVLKDCDTIAVGLKKPHMDGAHGGISRSVLDRFERKALKAAGVTRFGDVDSLYGNALDIALKASADSVRSARNPRAAFKDAVAAEDINEINARFWARK